MVTTLEAPIIDESNELWLDIESMDDDAFYDFCRKNNHLKFERNSDGNIIIMSNTGGTTGEYNAEILADFVFWNRKNKLGHIFDSSTAFKLANGAVRSADVTWVSAERWNSLTKEQREKFPPIAPDFVLELMSANDKLKKMQQKMIEYIENGVKLAWLIDPKEETVYIYRANGTIGEISGFDNKLSGEGILPDFELDLAILK
ncbi:MAG: Uma2 family endonuclease [Spirosomaceae bacterium]|jgi:Uma2 family endonuclease|nr:Uma2 family endonuclease [Spirosomataceae bacterium]